MAAFFSLSCTGPTALCLEFHTAPLLCSVPAEAPPEMCKESEAHQGKSKIARKGRDTDGDRGEKNMPSG